MSLTGGMTKNESLSLGFGASFSMVELKFEKSTSKPTPPALNCTLLSVLVEVEPGMWGSVEVILTVELVKLNIMEGRYLRVRATPFQFPSSINFPKPSVHPILAENGMVIVTTSILVVMGSIFMSNLYAYTSMLCVSVSSLSELTFVLENFRKRTHRTYFYFVMKLYAAVEPEKTNW